MRLGTGLATARRPNILRASGGTQFSTAMKPGSWPSSFARATAMRDSPMNVQDPRERYQIFAILVGLEPNIGGANAIVFT